MRRPLLACLLFLCFGLPLQAGDLSALFACLEGKGATLVSAHRGGPAPGFPENALETLKRGAAVGVRLFEIDVVAAKDGTLYLMHDRDLDRTTDGAGPVDALPWAAIRALRLKDNDGTQTDFHPPALADVLAWAVEADALLSLDIKRGTTVEALTQAVADAGAQAHVIYLAGYLDRAKAILAQQPGAMVSLSVNDRQTLDDIRASGIPAGQILLWTGFRQFDAEQVAGLDAAGHYVSFGTLGFGESYDDRIAASGDDSRYADLADDGLHMIATDRPLAARAALKAASQTWDSGTVCR